jgi:hypothetical protein
MRIVPFLLIALMSISGCTQDILEQLSGANPLIARLTAQDRNEILAMEPRQRYSKAYRLLFTECLNLARGAEEASDARTQNSSSRIITYLEIMLISVDDRDLEIEIVRTIREFIRMAESILRGSKDPKKAVHVRNLRDHCRQKLHPSKVRKYTSAIETPPPDTSDPISGTVVKKRSETALEKGKVRVRYFISIHKEDGAPLKDVEVSKEIYDRLSVGAPFEEKEHKK